MKPGDRIFLEGKELTAALATGLVEPHGTDSAGGTVYLVTRTAVRLAGSRSVGQTARGIQTGHQMIFGNGPVGLS